MLNFKLALIFTTLAGTFVQDLFRDVSLESALAAARSEKKIVMVDFFTTWCVPCKQLDATTWKDAKVLKWASEKVVAVKLDAEKERDLAKRFRIGAYPTILLLKPDGSEIDRIVGFKDADTFLSNASDALAGKDSVTRAKAKVDGHEQDPMVRQDYGRALVDAGRYADALEQYLWCFDHGEESLGYGGVRLSYLLSDIKRLGASYPAAIKALEERRDTAEANIDVDPTDFRSASDMSAINRELGTPKRILAVYDRVAKAGPIPAQFKIAVEREVLPLLVADKRYQAALDLVDDPNEHVRSTIASHQRLPDVPDASEEMKKALAEALVMTRASAVTECATIYEALLGIGNRDAASKVAEQLIAFVPTGGTYATLIRSAARAGTDDVAKALGERGLASLAEPEKALLRAAIDGASRTK